jgi:hypothetical protein
MGKYYWADVTTLYDGLEFNVPFTVSNPKSLTQEEIENMAEKMIVRCDSGEELYCVRVKEISKKDYEVLKKYTIDGNQYK